MSDWTSGYVADIGYTHGFYNELTPTILSLVALRAGIHAPDVTAPLAYCELGCGQGFSANLLAAANPHIQFHATDFNPAHIVGARALAAEAGIENVHFYEDAFADFVDRPELPEFDIITLHGIYSWIGAEHRASIVEFIRRKLKPGGLVYISYNTLPGWAVGAPMRHLMYLHGKAQGGPTIQRLDPALEFVGKIINANGRYFAANPVLKERWEQLNKQNRNYLAHEYLNDAWTLLYHSDVATELADAKLSYVGPAALIEQLDAVNLTPDQKTLMGEVQDPLLRETLRDYLTGQQFRRDVFVRGVAPLTVTQARTNWANRRFILAVPREKATLTIKGALGEATLHEAVYNPVLDALQGGPKTVQELLANKDVAELGLGRLHEALYILVGVGHALLALPGSGDTKRAKSTKPFNNAVINRARDSADLAYLASPLTGGGVAVGRINLLFLLAIQNGHKTPEGWAQFAWTVLQAQGHAMMKDGKTLETLEENIAELTSQATAFADGQLITLRNLLIA